MTKNKSAPEEIKRKKEYIRQQQIFKLKSNQRFLQKKLEQVEKEITDYEKEKEQTEKMIKRKG